MNTSTTFVLAATALLLASCASPRELRVEHHPELFAKLSEKDKLDVRQGRVHEGMTKDAVFLAWGKPSHVSMGKRDGKTVERWRYQAYQPVMTESYGFGMGVGIGGGYWGRHGYGYYYDPMFYASPSVSYVPVEGRSVEFVDGKVTAFMAPVRR